MSKSTTNISTKKSKIFQEAARLFQEKGYLASSMRELASRVGIEASSLYSHITSKEELLHKICFETAELYIQHWGEISINTNSSIALLEALIDFHIKMAFDNPVSVTVFSDEWKNLNPKDQSSFLKLRRAYENSILNCVIDGIDKKEIKALDPQTISHTILNGLRWVHFTQGKTTRASKAKMQQELKEILIGGIRQN